jgi:two-component system chemotaxis response regulator CheB
MSLQEQSLIGRPEITSIRMLLAVDSDVIRRVLSDFLRDEPLIEIVGEANDFTELLEKVLALKPRIVLMDLHMRDEYNFLSS